jgi:glutathione synthase/RimK-type ligase-like ATP-grasp enzyme
MKKLIYFDALIVYSEKFSASAADRSTLNQTPFSDQLGNESYNVVYGYFLEISEKRKLKIALTTSADIIGAGLCKSFWSFKNNKWRKNNVLCFSNLIFDKFAPINDGIKARRKLLFSSQQVKPFNSSELFELFFDKQQTYQKLAKYAIPTIALNPLEKTLSSIQDATARLVKLVNQHSCADDFSSEIVMKDRFGAGGENVYKFTPAELENMLATVNQNPEVSFIIQPFVKFDQGFSYNNALVMTDIRFVYLGAKIVQSYIRIAKPGDFRCNEHLGGTLIYLPLTDIPKKLVNRANLIAQVLNDQSSLYALDFVMSDNGNIYFLEGNTMPGLDWNTSLKTNAIEAKKLIRLVVEEIATRTNSKKHKIIKKPIKEVKLLKKNVAIPKTNIFPRTVMLS